MYSRSFGVLVKLPNSYQLEIDYDVQCTGSGILSEIRYYYIVGIEDYVQLRFGERQ